MLACGGCVLPPKGYKKPAGAASARETKTGKFWWGTSTSSYQNEDRGVAAGSPFAFKTDWDVFAEEGKIPPRGDGAAYGWSRFDKDVAALVELGVTHYRFGIEWARVEPRPGVFNEAAIAQYARMARQLKANGIEPIVTLWHFTFPDWLYDPAKKTRSNFLHPDVGPAWDRYVEKMAAALAPHVRIFVPQNEPNGDLYIGYFGGHWPPGILLGFGSLKKAHRTAVSMYRNAAATIRRHRPDAAIMGIYSLPNWRRNRLQDPTGFVYQMMHHQNWDHLDAVADVTDLIGVNYYYSQDASALRFIKRPIGEITSDYTQNGWEVDAEGLHTILMKVHRRYGKPMVVSENGIGTQSEQKKIRYYREHIAQLKRALNDGADIRGYLAWTLVDNYEWAEGYDANFGLTRLSPDKRSLLIEPSGRWFKNFIAARPNP
jgi:beta-glucosidase